MLMTITRADLIQYANSFGLALPAETPHSLALIVTDALSARSNRGLATPEQIERLIAHGYNPEIIMGLSWAHASEALRLLSADTVRTPEEPK